MKSGSFLDKCWQLFLRKPLFQFFCKERIKMGVSHLKDRPPYKPSGGEKRSVAIASVLSMSPDILVMDEPTSGLDPRARRRLIEQLKTFKHTKIIAGHDLDMAVDVCERTIVIHQAGVTADGPTLELLRDDVLLENSGLERPLQMQNCPVCGQSNPDSNSPQGRDI
jgi:cobalt/nickel transport system ATP-binding protein